ncbi:hypothetical protein AAFF_G00282680 [Aldrovandia affinis]|uniref:Uncharacterized protein n=1 Tax=Aldrovandia affinis TaxID=143900 RepID=A0AAD7X0Z3_9TELE|nr:hypothetical protein AAFF_G00282680 [Aldrovandia affinis]
MGIWISGKDDIAAMAADRDCGRITGAPPGRPIHNQPLSCGEQPRYRVRGSGRVHDSSSGEYPQWCGVPPTYHLLAFRLPQCCGGQLV